MLLGHLRFIALFGISLILSAGAATAAVPVGARITFYATADGTPAPTFQWTKDGTNIVGATAATFVIASATPADSGIYRATASNVAGTADSADEVLLVGGASNSKDEAPVFTLQPVATLTVVAGGSATLSASAAGAPTPTYQWLKNGVVIAGATNATFSIPSATTADVGIYEVVTSNSVGTLKSSGSVVTVTGPNAPPNVTGPSAPPNVTASTAAPSFILQPIASLSVAAGGNAMLSVATSGHPATAYQWRKNGINISGATAATLVLRGITMSDSATYSVLATNSGGAALSSSAVLTVGYKPAITAQPVSQAIDLGTRVSLSAAASGVPSPTLQWLKNGKVIEGATHGALVFSPVTSSDLAMYSVTASNQFGSVLSAGATLVVAAPPVIASHPVGQKIVKGATVTFAVEATGQPAPTFQWKKGKVNIPGATAARLTLTAVQLADEGDYSVEISNRVGGILSHRARLQVTESTLASSKNPDGTTGSGTPGTARTETETAIEGTGVASRLANLSVRSRAGGGDEGLIVGFVISGGSSKSMLLRGVGPTLGSLGVADALYDPTLSLYSGSVMTASNDDWSDESNALEIVETSARLGAFRLPESGADSAMMTNLETGAYTLQLTSKTSSTGVALAEVYDTVVSDPASLANVSVRTRVGTGVDSPNVGFVVSGTTPKRVMIRAVGPTLAAFGVTQVLADPQLEIFREGVLLDANDNWMGDPMLSETFARIGAFALADEKSRDAVLFMTLLPGAYTVVVSGVNNRTGIALVEVYDVP